MGAPRPDNGRLVDLSTEEYRALVEERVQRYLGISLDEFLAALDRGDLPDSAAVAHLKVLVGAAAAQPTRASRPASTRQRAKLASG
jgi:hypothetical protein